MRSKSFSESFTDPGTASTAASHSLLSVKLKPKEANGGTKAGMFPQLLSRLSLGSISASQATALLWIFFLSQFLLKLPQTLPFHPNLQNCFLFIED